MQDETISYPSVTVGVEHPMRVPNVLADLPPYTVMGTIEVTVSAPIPAAALLNAAITAAGGALDAINRHEKAHRSAQCGRTYIHLGHETTEGHCAGLDGTEGMTAGRTISEAP